MINWLQEVYVRLRALFVNNGSHAHTWAVTFSDEVKGVRAFTCIVFSDVSHQWIRYYLSLFQTIDIKIISIQRLCNINQISRHDVDS